ncbi:hypothetical protein DBR32_06855 [Taibaiella sp. KBW10]|uniref:hypothetical protein n=1 Tax=Taibaiella sp. KBW10 TaxID=2153357 RepID=UPI000F5A764A|nr:hypothetical protein [Taibaiella sp. KBW10]RQO31661.1 hypothetical protein DBR32_06855 [Taibaiella sp. KBW10]
MPSPQKEPSIWNILAKTFEGHYIEKQSYHSDKADLRFKDFQILCDYYTAYRTVGQTTVQKTYTRMVCPYRSANPFFFQIYPQGFLDRIGTLLGAQDILIGNEAFDRAFIIKGNDPYKITSLLNDHTIQDLIQTQRGLHIETSDQHGIWEDKLPEGTYELSLYLEGALDMEEQLKALYLLCTKLLTQLLKIDAIHPIYYYSQ